MEVGSVLGMVKIFGLTYIVFVCSGGAISQETYTKIIGAEMVIFPILDYINVCKLTDINDTFDYYLPIKNHLFLDNSLNRARLLSGYKYGNVYFSKELSTVLKNSPNIKEIDINSEEYKKYIIKPMTWSEWLSNFKKRISGQ